MSEAAQTLALGANEIREDFAKVDPDDSALRKCKGSNKADQQPNQQLRATSCGENGCYTGQTNRCSDCPCQQQLLPPESIDHAHRDQREDEVGEPDRDR